MKKLIWAVVVLSLAGVTASAQELSAANVSTYLGNSRWSWTIFLTGPKGVLDTVSYVEYTLHPTFPNPIQRVDRTIDPRYPFGFTANGWGTFTVGIKVAFKNGQVREFTHALEFVSASQSPCGPPIKLLSQNLVFLADERFVFPPVMIYVDNISDEWTKISPTLTIYYGPLPKAKSVRSDSALFTWDSDITYAALNRGKAMHVSARDFKSLQFLPDSRWSMRVQHVGDAMQFRYGGHYYLLAVNNVIANSGDNSYLDLQICEKLP